MLSRWPRSLRVAFAVWAVVGSFGFFVSIPLAITLAAFDAPSVLSAGRIPALMDRNLLLVSFALGLPMGLLMLFGELRSDWDNWRDAAQRGFLAILVVIFI